MHQKVFQVILNLLFLKMKWESAKWLFFLYPQCLRIEYPFRFLINIAIQCITQTQINIAIQYITQSQINISIQCITQTQINITIQCKTQTQINIAIQYITQTQNVK